MSDPEKNPVQEEYKYTNSRPPTFEIHVGPGESQIVFESREDEIERTKFFPPISED